MYKAGWQELTAALEQPGLRAGCLPRLIGINCARLQSRTESLTLAASQHFFLIVLMITTRADDHCGALIVRRTALCGFSRWGRETGCPHPRPPCACAGRCSPGWAGGAVAPTRVVPCAQSPHQPLKLWQGDGKDRGGDSSPLPSRGREQLVPHPLALPHGRGVAGRGTDTRRENIPHPESRLGQGHPRGCLTLAVPRRKRWAALLPWVPQMQLGPHQLPRPHQALQEGPAWRHCPGSKERGEQPANNPH